MAKSFTLVSSWFKKKKKNLPEKSSSELMDYRIGGVGLCESAIRLWATRFVDFFYGAGVGGAFQASAAGSVRHALDTGTTIVGVKKTKKKKTLEDTTKSTCHDVCQNLTWGAACLKDILMQK